jgi:hypothetical protein
VWRGSLTAAFWGAVLRSIAAIRSPLLEIYNWDRGTPLWEGAAVAKQAENDQQWDQAAQPEPEVEFDQSVA